ncbi:MAG: MarR family winged helix-turn-helix transcriptional regulator [Gemmatimonadaceae bacterium]
MTTRADVAAVMRDYPRIYLACHRRHVRDAETGALVSARQASILDHLDAVDPTTLTDLAAHMGVTPGTMSVAVDRLVRAGYVTREVDEADRRRVRLRLAATGVRLRTAHSVLDPALVGSMLSALSEADRQTALRGLALLAGAAAEAQRARAPAPTRRRA